MAAWDWYPYDAYCVELSWNWLWLGAGPRANLGSESSTFNVKFAEAAYHAYRKGGVPFAEQFKDCIVSRYAARLRTEVVEVGTPTADELAQHLSLRLLSAIAQARSDIDREAALASARTRRVASSPAPTVTRETFLDQLVPILPVQPPSGPTEPLPMPTPAEPRGALVTETRSWQGYTYRIVAPAAAATVMALLDQLRVVGDVEIDVGVKLPGKLLGFEPSSVGGDADEWARARMQEGYAVLVGEGEAAGVESVLRIVNQSAGGEGYAVATRDVSVVSALNEVDPTSAVLNEPSAGWVEPSAEDLAAGREAGVLPSKTVLYVGLVAGVGVLAVGAYYLGRRG